MLQVLKKFIAYRKKKNDSQSKAFLQIANQAISKLEFEFTDFPPYISLEVAMLESLQEAHEGSLKVAFSRVSHGVLSQAVAVEDAIAPMQDEAVANILGKFLLANDKKKGEEVVEQVNHAIDFCVDEKHEGRSIFTGQMHEVMCATKTMFDHKSLPTAKVKEAWVFVNNCLKDKKGCPIIMC